MFNMATSNGVKVQSDPRVRVLIADGDWMVNQLLVSALTRQKNLFLVVGSACDSEEAIRLADVAKPHVAILSAELQDGQGSGLGVMRAIKDKHPSIAVVMLLRAPDRDLIVHSFREGARGIFCRTDSLQSLTKCIRSVHQGQIWASNRDIEYALEALGRARAPELKSASGKDLLNESEREVIGLVADGLRNREIAQALGVKEHSVSNRLYRIYDKLGISNRIELILYAQNRTVQ
jgi:DNA-binding NarL/FixJ family response regulator